MACHPCYHINITCRFCLFWSRTPSSSYFRNVIHFCCSRYRVPTVSWPPSWCSAQPGDLSPDRSIIIDRVLCCLYRPAYTYCYVLRRWVVGSSCVIAHRCPFTHLVGWFAPNLSTVRKQPVLRRVGDTTPSRLAVLEFHLHVSSPPEILRGPCDIMGIHGVCK